MHFILAYVKKKQYLCSKVDAKEEAASEGKRLIDLMDGEELINKLAEYGIGLNEVKSYEVDEDFFNSLLGQ